MRTMSWFFVALLLSLTYVSVSEASHGKKIPSAVVVGTVYCDTCLQQAFSTRSHFISGASVAVECNVGNSAPSFKQEVKTNEYGEFKVQLPFKVWKQAKRVKGCTFKLISSSESHCAVPSIATSSSATLMTRKQGEHIFSAGLFSFKPTIKPNFCNQKQSIVPNSKEHVQNESSSDASPSTSDEKSSEDTFFPFPFPFLPPISLPPIPFLPPLFPFPPNPFLPPSPPAPSIPPPISTPPPMPPPLPTPNPPDISYPWPTPTPPPTPPPYI